MEISHTDSNRVGRLLIKHELLREDRALVGALLALCTVIHVEDHESGRGKAFIVACDAMDELAEGGNIPDYRVESTYDQAFENPEWQQRRVDSGKFGFAFFRRIVIRVPAIAMSMQPRGAALH
jgi:hypothetical protein